MKRCKGILALLLSVMITLTFTPSIAFAGSGDVGDPDSGVVAGQQGEVQTQEGGGDVEQQPEAEAPAAEEGDGQQSEAKAPLTRSGGALQKGGEEPDGEENPPQTRDVTDPEASIGETGYATLSEALDAVQANETIVLQKDVTAPKQSFDGNEIADSQSFVITKTDHFTIDLAGHTISGSNKSTSDGIIVPTKATTFAAGIFSLHGANVDIVDSVGEGTIENTYKTSGVIIESNPATLSVNGIRLYSPKNTNGKNGAIGIKMYTAGESHVTVNNTIIDCGNPFTGYVGSANPGSTMTINSGTFTSCDGGNKCLFGNSTNQPLQGYGTLTINGGTFINEFNNGFFGGSFDEAGCAKGGVFYGGFASHIAFLTAEGHYAKMLPVGSGMPGEYYFEIIDSDDSFAASTEFTSSKSYIPPGGAPSVYPTSVIGVESGIDAGELIASDTTKDITRTITVKDDVTLNKTNYGGTGGAVDNLIVDIAAGKTVTGAITTRLATVQSTGEGTFDVSVTSADTTKYEVTYDNASKKYTSDFISSEIAVTLTDADGNVKKFSSATADNAFANSNTGFTEGSTLKLYKDISTTKTIPGGGNRTVDFNGHTLTYTGSSNDVIQMQSSNKTVSLVDTSEEKGGVLDGTGAKRSVICLSSASNSSSASPNLVIGEGVTVKGCVMVCGKSKLDVYGSIVYDTSGDAPLNANSGWGKAEQVITLHSGSVVSNNQGEAIYKPQSGKLIIEDGATVIGKTKAIEFRQGELIIKGGIFTSTNSGSAVSIQKGASYADGVAATISGGTFTSPEGVAPIESVGLSASDTPITGFMASEKEGDIVLSDEVDASCLVAGFTLKPYQGGKYTLSDAAASITEDDETTFYGSFAAAVEAANGTKTIKLLGDVTDTYKMAVGETLIVDKNGFKFKTPEVDGANIVTSTHEGTVYTYTTAEAVWEVTTADGVRYAKSLNNDLTSPSGEMTFKLLKDTSIGRTCVGSVLSRNFTVTLDLNGKTLTSTNTDSSWSAIYFHDQVKGGKLIMKNGTFNVPAQCANALHVRASQTVNLDSDLTINAGCDGVYIEGEGATLNSSATITSQGNYGIVGNGSNGKGGTTVNVTGGTVSANDVGIFQPQAGELNISGGTITAPTAVYVKSGSVNVSDGTIHSTGTAADYEYTGSGCNPTGDALVIDSCGYPGGAPVPSITGGTFISDHANGVASYAGGDETKPVGGFVSGGTFDGALTPELCAEGKMPEKNADGTYGVKDGTVVAGIDEEYYSSFDDAVAAANGTKAIKLYVDFEEPYDMSNEDKLIVNKNGHKFVTPIVSGAYVVSTSSEGQVFTYVKEEAIWEVTAGSSVTYAKRLQDVTSRPANGAVIKLLKDTNIGRTCVGSYFYDNFSVTLDLNGKTLTSTNTDSGWSALYFHDRVKNGALTIKNGTFVVPAQCANALHVREGQTMNLESDLTIECGCDGVFIEGEGATLNSSATITSQGNYGIVGNGSNGKGGTTVNVTGGTVSAKDVGIYQPQAGELNISGGTITAPTAVYVKSGSVNVSDGTIHSTGTAADYEYTGSGCNPTGDALVIDSCGYPGGAPAPSITGGTFISDHANGIASYSGGSVTEPVVGFVAGGLFSTPVPADYCTNAFAPSNEPDENGMYGLIDRTIIVKAEALEELDGVKVEDYVEAHQYKIHRLVDIARNNVENAESVSQIEAIMDSFRTDLAKYTTLEKAKDEAKTALENYKSDVEFVDANARGNIVETYLQAINDATTSDAIYTALADAKEAIDALPTKADEEAQSLSDAKADAIEAINAKLSDAQDKILDTDKTTAEISALNAKINVLIAVTTEQVGAAVQTFNNTIDGMIEAKAEADRLLAEAKTNAIAKLDKINLAKYIQPEKNKVKNAIAKAKKSIESATTVAAVNKAVTTANNTIKKQGVYNAKLPKIKNQKPVVGKKTMTVKWTKLSKNNLKKVSGFEIQYAQNKAFTKNAKMITVKKSSKSKKIKKLVSKKTYWVRVRTYQKTSTGKMVGKWSNVKTVKVK